MRKGNQKPMSQTTLTPTETRMFDMTETHCCDSQTSKCHQVEEDVRRLLLNDPALHFADLVIRRVPDGVCLEGYLEMDCESGRVCDLAQQVAGVQTVLNRLITSTPSPQKG